MKRKPSDKAQIAYRICDLLEDSSDHLFRFLNAGDLITVDSEIMGGMPVFKGTRVPIKSLFNGLRHFFDLARHAL